MRRTFRAIGWLVLVSVLASGAPIGLLRWFPPPTSAFMLHSHVADPATGRACESVEYEWVPWRDLSRQIPRAIVVSEDQRFFEHEGFDTKAIGDALDEFAAGGRMRGASTISQQVAKNLFLWPDRSFVRKGLEAWLTVWIEFFWSKRRILEVHANIAQFGPCVFGAQAASRKFFGIEAARINARQAALLAAVLPSPGKMLVADPGPFTEERAAEIFHEMNRGGGPIYLQRLK